MEDHASLTVQALNRAMKIFWQKGYTATSMNDLYEAMGIKSPSLYAAFGSKEDLYEEVLLHYEQSVAPVIWGHMTSEPSPRQAVWLWLERSADMLTQTDMPHGCMVTLSAVGSEGNDRLGDWCVACVLRVFPVKNAAGAGAKTG